MEGGATWSFIEYYRNLNWPMNSNFTKRLMIWFSLWGESGAKHTALEYLEKYKMSSKVILPSSVPVG